MKICTKCVLPETFPGINFDEQGVCNFCHEFKGNDKLEEEKKKCYQKFIKLIEEVQGKSDYDCLLAYSGGKDSTYTLYLLKEQFKLTVLTVTFDNGFVSEQAFKNIRSVTENLGVDNIIFKADFQLLKKIFLAATKQSMFPMKALERASSICNCCIAFVKFTALKFAIEKRIPIIAWGWSPGQAPIRSSIMKMSANLFKSTQEMYRRPMFEIIGSKINHYFLKEELFRNDNFPWNVNILAFLDYNEDKIIKTIKSLGWVNPTGLDTNSTNCLLNSFANVIHMKRYNFHPYAFEIAVMVRTGLLDRQNGLRKIYQEEDNPNLLSMIESKLK
ncbi:MAG: 7-cyano-7-deazaguanine synthase [Candidatus Omnitrophica bacterium]|nr:7-cyano-7-deazaguanine synthase [Candidatus Omnitrophota bacterium]